MAAGEHNPEDLKKSTMLAGEGAPLNEKYVRMTSVVFQDIYEKMKGKQYSGVTFNGENLSRVMQQAATTINNGQGVKVDEMYLSPHVVSRVSRRIFPRTPTPVRKCCSCGR